MKSMTRCIENYDEISLWPDLFVIFSMTSLSYHIPTAEGGVHGAR